MLERIMSLPNDLVSAASCALANCVGVRPHFAQDEGSPCAAKANPSPHGFRLWPSWRATCRHSARKRSRS